jgi:hypothetical protein
MAMDILIDLNNINHLHQLQIIHDHIQLIISDMHQQYFQRHHNHRF